MKIILQIRRTHGNVERKSCSDTIDEEIEVLEQKIADLDSEMMKSATNSVKLGELMVKKEETEKALEEKMDRWVYLNDLNERILNGE